eukprot:scaffold13.g164.t1
MAPETFSCVDGASAVTRQPETEAERRAALQALLACPTYSIHARRRAPGELAAVRDAFPLPVPGCADVYHCGYHSEDTFGATSYFIRRSSGSNVMVDSPRWQPQLAQRLTALGGVAWIVLSHRDDVADHAAWVAAFPGARRVIHRSEASRRQGTDKAEVLLEGEGPWALDGTPLPPSSSSSSEGSGSGDGPEVRLLFTPGHTCGCVSLYYAPDRALLTGDSLAWSARLQRLTIFRAHNWHSVPQQLESMARLTLAADAPAFLHLLPGHGRRTAFADDADRTRQMLHLLREEGYAGYARVAAAVAAADAALAAR